MLQANSLVKKFGSATAVANISLGVDSGELLAIMGPSGSGKSTLAYLLSGILKPDSGSIQLDGQEITTMSDAERSQLRRKKFGFVFQDGQLVPELSGRENVALPLLLNGVSRRKAMRIAGDWLVRLGVGDQAGKRPGEMSGGQAQRVAVARAMAPNPEIVFADEPTGALDQATGHEMMQLLSTTCRMNGTMLVLITHDIKVASWCDRLVELRDGLIHTDRPLALVNANAERGQ